MKFQITLLFSLFCLATFGQKKYELKPDAQGYLIIRGTYKPGDTLQLNGYFKAVAVYDLFGAVDKPITITNVPGKALIIGDSLWSGGSWSHGLAVRNSRYLHIYGSTKDNFKIVGANTTKVDANGYPTRTAYFDFMITEMSDNFKVHDITIRHGGVGILCKTDVSASNSKSWYPNTYLENFEFYNLDIFNTYNEAMYIGHTATYWNLATSQPVYSGTINPNTMKQPIKLRNVKIHHNTIHDIHNDAIQTAAIDNLQVYDNAITNWAIKKDYSHNGGILIGGRVKDFEVVNNKVANGWGEFLQIYADAGKAIVKNNLFVGNKLSGIGLRGGKDLVVEFTNNTIIQSGESAFRINGTGGATGKNIIKKNIIAQPGNGRYYYMENGGAMSDEDNKTFPTLALAQLSASYLPVAGSPSIGYGYAASEPPIPDPDPEVKPLKLSITIPSLTLSNLGVGTHTMKLTFPDGKTADVKIVVEQQ
jgi:hypothetical protein